MTDRHVAPLSYLTTLTRLNIGFVKRYRTVESLASGGFRYQYIAE